MASKETSRFVSPCPEPTPHQREIITILIEEAAEVQQRATKLLRFGIDEVQPGQSDANSRRLGMEVGDFIEMVERATKAGIFQLEDVSDGRVRKRSQLKKFMQTNATNV